MFALSRALRTAGLGVLVVAFGLSSLLGSNVTPAAADTAPASGSGTYPATPATVSADALPTWQLTGVVWSQVLVGNTVYATGNFTKARPAGAAAGSASEIDVAHLFAYDIRTGERIASFDHRLNGQGLVVTASADGRRLYVGGDFTAVDGAARSHLAAFDTTTGALVGTFIPAVNGQVTALHATATSLYVGGTFTAGGGQARKNLAAFSPSSGALQTWAPKADAKVWAITAVPDGSKIIIGGQFPTINGTAVHGMGAVDPKAGVLKPWAANAVIQNQTNGAITTLTTDGTYVYGGGYGYGTGANFEGSFSLNPADGSIRWMVDCQGDTYGVQPIGSVVYTVSHTHNCSMIGGFPDTKPRVRWQRAGAFTSYPTGTNSGPNVYGRSFKGQPAPTMLHWYPSLGMGQVTGQYQAGWSVVGNSQFVAMAGEFPTVNGKPQAGLVRFTTASAAPNQVGPQYDTVPARTVPATTATALTGGGVRVSFGSAWDKDNQRLTYAVYRDYGTAAQQLVATTTADTTFWTLPTLSVSDPTAPVGDHTYRVRITDPFGNTLLSPVSASVTVTDPLSPYAAGVIADGAQAYWRLGDGGDIAVDKAGVADARRPTGVTFGSTGAVDGDDDRAAAFAGTTTSSLTAGGATTAAPTTFTVEAWFRTASTTGGTIVGFGPTAAGAASERLVYLTNQGSVVFGVATTTGTRTVVSPGTYRDNAWHHVAATQDASGTTLYVDGVRVAQNTTAATLRGTTGSWRIGGGTPTGWPSAPTSANLSGLIDEVAVYPTVLAASTIATHHQVAGPRMVTTTPTQRTTPRTNPTPTRVQRPTETSGQGTNGTRTATGRTAPTRTWTPAGSLVRDPFSRTEATGWGTAVVGGSWTVVPATGSGTQSAVSVSDGSGRISIDGAGAGPALQLAQVSSTDTDLRVDLSADTVVAGKAVADVVVRGDVESGYAVRLSSTSDQEATLTLLRLDHGTETVLSTQTVPGVAVLSGATYAVRVQAWGTGTTQLQARVWRPEFAEPTAWPVSASDTTAALQTGGGIAVRAYGAATPSGEEPVPTLVGVTQVVAQPTGH